MREHKNISEKKKRIRLPVHVYLLYLLVATLIVTGVTFSKYLTSTNAGDSARVAAFGDLELVEIDQPKKYIITPGVNISKNPQVSFGVNKPSEMAAYVFVGVDAGGWQYDHGTYKIVRETDSEELLSWSVDDNWTQLGDEPVFYCTVPAGGSISGLPVISDNTIKVSAYLYASEYAALDVAAKSITFRAYAVQVQGFDSVGAAWSAVNDKH